MGFFCFLLLPGLWPVLLPASVPAPGDSAKARNPFNFHFQQTIVYQEHPSFSARYSGPNSLHNSEEGKTSLTSTLFLGLRLWKGGELYFNPEIAGGSGLSQAKGLGGFTNGETFRVGDPAPQLYVARAYIRQNLWTSGPEVPLEDQANQLPTAVQERVLRLWFGKFSLADVFDQNAYSHDPRSQFLNWSLMSMGAWDFPANTRGYTWAGLLEYKSKAWEFRMAVSMVPHLANGPFLDARIRKANAGTLELQRNYQWAGQAGKIRLVCFGNQAQMGAYAKALTALSPDVVATRSYGRTKFGWGVNWEQSVSNQAGFFGRISWNDGKNETWAFTEIDRSVHLGWYSAGHFWKRSGDTWGAAFCVNGLSQVHADYLKAGGLGFMLGDGKLNYRPEIIGEIFYSFQLHEDHFFLTPDYQFVLNPGYNHDRGPVHVFSLRMNSRF